jgi:uncharacterized protein (DUF1778 family)
MAVVTKPAAKAKEPRTGRMNLRLSASAKTLLTEAAQLCGLSLSEYVLRHSLDAAHQQLAKARYSPISEADTLHIAERIEEATPPTKGLERAAKTYHQRVAGVRE